MILIADFACHPQRAEKFQANPILLGQTLHEVIAEPHETFCFGEGVFLTPVKRSSKGTSRRNRKDLGHKTEKGVCLIAHELLHLIHGVLIIKNVHFVDHYGNLLPPLLNVFQENSFTLRERTIG